MFFYIETAGVVWELPVNELFTTYLLNEYHPDIFDRVSELVTSLRHECYYL